ncbi:MAG: DUF3108 domain-containing protein [Proteobacteria bacterium]|nr:MAG: DUF3108 domain-containing protein [Pseudomonadota bacterium]
MTQGWIVSLIFSLILTSSCSTPKIAPISESTSPEVELPKEIQTQFAVKEVKDMPPPRAPTPTPTATSAAVPTSKTSKKSSKKKASAAETRTVTQIAEAAPAFQYPLRRKDPVPFWVGEKQSIEVTFFGMAAGEFELETMPLKQVNGRKVFHFEGRAKSSSVFALVYRLNDKIESFMDYDGIFSHRFHMLLDQTRQRRDSLELFDHEKKQVYYWNRKNHVEKGYSEIKEYKEISPFTQDSFSAYFYARTLPLEPGASYIIPVSSEGKSWEMQLTVVRREMIDTPLGKKQAVVVRPQTRFQGVLKQDKGESYIWLSDDDRRFILRFEAQVKIGTVVGSLKKVTLGEPPSTAQNADQKPENNSR